MKLPTDLNTRKCTKHQLLPLPFLLQLFRLSITFPSPWFIVNKYYRSLTLCRVGVLIVPNGDDDK